MAGRIDIKLVFCSILIFLVTHGACQGELLLSLCANTVFCQLHALILPTCIKCTRYYVC